MSPPRPTQAVHARKPMSWESLEPHIDGAECARPPHVLQARVPNPMLGASVCAWTLDQADLGEIASAEVAFSKSMPGCLLDAFAGLRRGFISADQTPVMLLIVSWICASLLAFSQNQAHDRERHDSVCREFASSCANDLLKFVER